jgi:ketosteroid isomerase-like protein
VSQENVEIVRRAIAASTSEPPDVETLRAILDPEHVLITDWGVEKGRHQGVEGYLAAIGEMEAAWNSLTQEVERVLDAGERGVVVLMRLKARGKESGAAVENPWAMVVVLRDGRIVTSRAFLQQDEALKAVGLTE